MPCLQKTAREARKEKQVRKVSFLSLGFLIWNTEWHPHSAGDIGM